MGQLGHSRWTNMGLAIVDVSPILSPRNENIYAGALLWIFSKFFKPILKLKLPAQNRGKPRFTKDAKPNHIRNIIQRPWTKHQMLNNYVPKSVWRWHGWSTCWYLITDKSDTDELMHVNTLWQGSVPVLIAISMFEIVWNLKLFGCKYFRVI